MSFLPGRLSSCAGDGEEDGEESQRNVTLSSGAWDGWEEEV